MSDQTGSDPIERAPDPVVVGGVADSVAEGEIPRVVTEAVFETRGLSVRYSGLRAVRDVDLVIRRGEITAFIGSSGCNTIDCPVEPIHTSTGRPHERTKSSMNSSVA